MPASKLKAHTKNAALIGGCLIVGAVCFIATIAVSLDLYGETGMDALMGFFVADLGLGVVAAALVVPARRRLWLNFVIIAIGITSSFAALAWIVAALRVGKVRRLPLDIAVVAFMVLTATGFTVWQDSITGDETNTLVFAVVVGIVATAVLAWGRARGAREELVEALRQKANIAQEAQLALERQRAAELAGARAEERSALARELHDGVAHQLAIAAMHTGAITARDDLDAQRIQEIAETARQSTAYAGVLLREALVTLRTQESTDLLPPPASVEEVIAEARDRGVDVAVLGTGLDEPQVQQHKGLLFQITGILREALVNVEKHAPGAQAQVSFESNDCGISMTIRNPLTEPPKPDGQPGFGVVGMEERARILGGQLHAGVVEQEFEVKVRVPWGSE